MKTAWCVTKGLTSFFMPWIVVGYVWGVGLHWVVIGLAGMYALTLLVAIGYALGEVGVFRGR